MTKYGLMILFFGFLSAPCAFAGNESHGGGGALINEKDLDAGVEIGDQKIAEVFDVLDYDAEFVPSELKEFESHISPALATLKSKLPRTAHYLREIFSRGLAPRWYFVKYKLKRVKEDWPSTNQILTFEHIQAALNDGVKVQIQRSFWEKLEPRSKARLLVHEALRSAIGFKFPQPTPRIRSLASLLLHRNLASFPKDKLAEELLNELEICSDGTTMNRLYQLVRSDAGSLSGELEDWQDVTVLEDGITPGKCTYLTDQCVFRDPRRFFEWTRTSPDSRPSGTLSWSKAKDACSNLRDWGGHGDWALPTFSQLQDAIAKLGSLSRKLEAFGHEHHFVWASTIPFRDPWSAAPPDFDPSERWRWAWELASGKARAINETAAVSYLCVRDALKLWDVLAVGVEARPKPTCEEASDECGLVHKRSRLIWSEPGPNYVPSYSGPRRPGDQGETELVTATTFCRNLKWMGIRGWRLPTYREFLEARADGAFGRALKVEAFGNLKGVFWTSSGGNTTARFDEGEARASSPHRARFLCVREGH